MSPEKNLSSTIDALITSATVTDAMFWALCLCCKINRNEQ